MSRCDGVKFARMNHKTFDELIGKSAGNFRLSDFEVLGKIMSEGNSDIVYCLKNM